MSGLYNAIFGTNNQADQLLAALDLKRDDFYRFRDCNLEDRDGHKVIAVYTRGGGNNRECWSEYYPPAEGEEGCRDGVHRADCVVSLQERNHEHILFLADDDDDFDHTYCTIYFRIPQEIAHWAEGLDVAPDRDTAWADFLTALRDVQL